MNSRELCACCLAHAGVVEDFPFGPEHSVFKVAGKMFALSTLDGTPLEVSVKCEPEMAVELRGTYAAIRPGYHLNKRHWNTITLDGSLRRPARTRPDRGLVRPRRERAAQARTRAARLGVHEQVQPERVSRLVEVQLSCSASPTMKPSGPRTKQSR